jgi:predicted RNA methylase
MTAHRQAAELLRPHLASGDSVLDAGCGSGAFYHSLARMDVAVDYYGIDAAPSLIAVGQAAMPTFGLPADRLTTVRIEDLSAEVDHVVCINVLSNVANYHSPLERLLLAARKTVVLRESISDAAQYSYVKDNYLDAGVDLKVHVNTYARDDIRAFIEAYGFDIIFHTDEYTGGVPQDVIGHPHWWTFVKAVRRGKGA